MKTRLSLILILLLAASFHVQARIDSLHLEEVVVTATRTSVHRDNVPATISIVSRQEIEESGETALLPVLSARVPGLFVTERGIMGFGVSNGSAGNITLRGVGGGTGLLVLIDGHPQYMGVMGHHLPDAYMTSDAERVEILRGPASLLYGSNAMGGAINIITRSASKTGWHGSGKFSTGLAYNTREYQANAAYKNDRLNIFLSINHDRTDGNRDNKSAAFKITNGYIKTAARLSNYLRATADASIAAYETRNPGPLAAPLVDNVANILRGVVSASLENDFGKTRGTLALFYNFGEHEIDDGHGEGDPEKNFLFRSSDHNRGMQFYQTIYPFRGNMITVGVDYKNFGGHARDDYKDGITPDTHHVDTTIDEIAGYLLVRQTLYNKLTLSAGIRLEHHESFGNEWVPQAGIAYNPFRDSFIKLSIAKGFRAPVLRDLYYRAGWAGANPGLKPETMLNHELAIGQTLLDGRLSVEATGFISRGKNRIVTEWSGGAAFTRNTGPFNHDGLELSARWTPSRALRLDANYAYLHAGAFVAYAPRHQFKLIAAYTIDRWNLSANYRHASRVYSTATTREHFNLVDARVAFRPCPDLLLFIRAENLTDTSYEILNDYPMPGVTASCGVNVTF
ncbi:MAG: TonB-dependent receptor [Odoribacteraceae bacterium]|jgi:iron complex outermembrane receptor protein|nr:TonB-dependent receptor [Odoribacteraceae bacterium]